MATKIRYVDEIMRCIGLLDGYKCGLLSVTWYRRLLACCLELQSTTITLSDSRTICLISNIAPYLALMKKCEP
jgi:hypothetical protein